mmetsp:Transcript_34456/g.68002  ORF Transcript_34456/g.68002 Transcript_34456/m.68002 type:complete len:219 (-) Transcript_34456:837-1493(-)
MRTPPLKDPTAESPSMANVRASPMAALTAPNSTHGLSDSASTEASQPFPTPPASISSLVIPLLSTFILKPPPSGAEHKFILTLTRGISTTPVREAPATLTASLRPRSSSPVAKPSSIAVCQLIVLNMLLVSTKPRNALHVPSLLCIFTGKPSSPAGSAMPLRCVTPKREPPVLVASEKALASLKCCSFRTRSNTMSYFCRKGRPSIPCSVAFNALVAI